MRTLDYGERVVRRCAVKREGWRNDHILVVSEEDERLDWVEKQFVRRLGERLYGNGGKGHD